MENFEANSSTPVAVEAEEESTKYNREAVEMMSMEEALDKFEARFEGAILLPTAEKITALKTLIGELGATVEGTDIPVHNEHRHVVESLARLLRVEESRLEFEMILAKHPEVAS
jgi:hypothetical protein